MDFVAREEIKEAIPVGVEGGRAEGGHSGRCNIRKRGKRKKMRMYTIKGMKTPPALQFVLHMWILSGGTIVDSCCAQL